MQGNFMDILTIKEASLVWGISIRRITVLCNEGEELAVLKKLREYSFFPKMQKSLKTRDQNR